MQCYVRPNLLGSTFLYCIHTRAVKMRRGALHQSAVKKGNYISCLTSPTQRLSHLEALTLFMKANNANKPFHKTQAWYHNFMTHLFSTPLLANTIYTSQKITHLPPLIDHTLTTIISPSRPLLGGLSPCLDPFNSSLLLNEAQPAHSCIPLRYQMLGSSYNLETSHMKLGWFTLVQSY